MLIFIVTLLIMYNKVAQKNKRGERTLNNAINNAINLNSLTPLCVLFYHTYLESVY